jgi:hypothetical protein
MKAILILFLAITTLTACGKLTNTVWVHYDETYCADPWGNNSVSKEDKKKNVVKYFKDKGIKIHAIEILNNGTEEMCFACHCHSGIRIKCRVKKKDVEALHNANFY